jgi:hypothetical protein
MIMDDGTRRWFQRADTWRYRLANLGLDGLLASLAPALHPFGTLGAQALWMAEGALGPLNDSLAAEAGSLAGLLDDPVAFDRLLKHLAADVGSAAETE